ncbi:pseudouridine-metabolizing bifunctional protein C1861.05 isoform X2 [Chelonus insularis]|nr:pseudouridine-metabolizing bifunctional protein C1861.05 isoform X2 [Chelonus insularis]XP_034943464.1 pseudouridine-metabolizing bifunctional protein C1861.05 isoform X2 [Chelonus insularis]
MSNAKINNLAQSSDNKINSRTVKCGQRDICTAIAQNLNGGTTVGGTVTIAHLAGIKIMATGGIGGVHRGVEKTLDISSDLVVLSRTPVSVVCAGVKAILDIPKTLEFLETLGVPVIAIGDDTKLFPAFYSRFTPAKVKSPSFVSDATVAARCIKAQQELKANTGLIFAVPIPEAAALDPFEVDRIIQMALEEVEQINIQGKDVTPYLLKKVKELTEGKSLSANKTLIENNALVAADIAIELSHLTSESSYNFSKKFIQNRHFSSKKSVTDANLVVVGGVVLDTVLQVEEPEIRFDGRTHRGKSQKSFGGVGRNIASALITLGAKNTKFVTAVGDDEAGKMITQSFGGAKQIIIKLPEKSTARYTSVIDINGECRFGFGEMEIFNSIDCQLIENNLSAFEKAQLIILDGNPPLKTIQKIIDIASRCSIPVWFEPTDAKKACKIFKSTTEWNKVLHFVSPNIKELFAMLEYFSITKSAIPPPNIQVDDIQELAVKLAEKIPVVITTLGPDGLLINRRCSSSKKPFYNSNGISTKNLVEDGTTIQSRLHPPVELNTEGILSPRINKVSVSGCGDCLAAAIITGILRGLSEEMCITLGLKAAAVSLKSFENVPQALALLE